MSTVGEKLTPAMRQYRQIKAEHPDDILFFRMGDFYEMFFEDAKVVSRVLGIALTSRSNGIPMAGFPWHAAEGYINRMVRAGYRVAICDQLEDAKQAKGVVKRGVTQVVTAGTVTSDALLNAKANLYIAAVCPGDTDAGLAWLDTTTGAFLVTETSTADLLDEIARINPAEILIAEEPGSNPDETVEQIRRATGATLTPQMPWCFEQSEARRTLTAHFGTNSLAGFGCEEMGPGIGAAGALLNYVRETQKADLKHVARLERYTAEETLVLDRATLTSLEIVEPLRGEGGKGATLVGQMDRSRTAMGGRALRRWLLAPLRKVDAIERRQDAVEELIDRREMRDAVGGALRGLADMERLIARISTGRCNARDLAHLRDSIPRVDRARDALDGASATALTDILPRLGGLGAMYDLLCLAIEEAPPVTVREGGMIRKGYEPILDELAVIATEGKAWIARYQAEESKRLGIANLKVGYNKVFGYYIEIPHSQSSKVPDSFIRKQTIKNAERYITPELKEYETKVLTASDRARDLEYDLFCRVRETVSEETATVQRTAEAIGELDVLLSFAETAADLDYRRPKVDDSSVLSITDGRHPVLEQTLVEERFVPNDVLLDDGENRVAIITGPNMAGKSTYIRQVALLVILAQAGSFLPVRRARIGVADRIFTRVGAADEIARGNSTFMVEMNETANILNNATARSILILDEVGRGTSTFDGLSIAWAITEYLYGHVGARTLFATHYHELTELARIHPGIQNYNVSVKEWGEKILFLHKIEPGGTDKSYGIHVAQLAGVPATVIDRARQILGNMEANALDANDAPILAHGGPEGKKEKVRQMSLFAALPHAVEAALRRLDPETITPLEALSALKELKDKLD